MIGKVIGFFAGSSLRRWVLGAGLSLIIGGAAIMWHNHKQKLIDQGEQQCVQVINEQTMIDLQNALVAERSAAAKLRVKLAAVAVANQKARQRLRESESLVTDLKSKMDEQEEQDETYKEWRNSDLPNGVAERLRSIDSESDSNTSN